MRNLAAVLDDATDHELLDRSRHGDDTAFGELYRRHVGAARVAARRLTRSSVDADDAVAEAFTRILAVIRRGGGPEIALRPYLTTVVRNVCYDRSGTRRRETLPGEMELVSAIDDHPDTSTTEFDRAAESDLLRRAFGSLSDRWQRVLRLTDIEGRSPKELAEDLELAPGAVAALAFRAREGLADAYLAAHVQPTPSRCDHKASDVARFVRNRMPAKERVLFDRHVDECRRCAEAVDELRLVNGPLRSLVGPAALATSSVGVAARIMDVIRKIVTVKVMTATAAAAVSVASVAAVEQGSFEPFDALRPLSSASAPTPTTAPAPGDAISVPATRRPASSHGADASMGGEVTPDATAGSAPVPAPLVEATPASLPATDAPGPASPSPGAEPDTTIALVSASAPNPTPSATVDATTPGDGGTDGSSPATPDAPSGTDPATTDPATTVPPSAAPPADANGGPSEAVAPPVVVSLPPLGTLGGLDGGQTQSTDPADDPPTTTAPTSTTVLATSAM